MMYVHPTVNTMTPENFCYWLQGFFEITGKSELTPEQTKMVKEHLGYVFAGKPSTYSTSSPLSGLLDTTLPTATIC